MHTAFCRLSCAKETQHQSSTFAHDVHEGTGEREKDVHWCGYRKGDALGAMQRKGLRHNLTKDYVHVGNKRKRYGGCNAMSVNGGMRNAAEKWFNQSLNGGFSQPAECQAGVSDAELNPQQDLVEIPVQ